MTAQNSVNPVTLRCNNCGHEWKARHTGGKARQCSKCRSRSISEVAIDDRVSLTSQSPLVNSNEHTARDSHQHDDSIMQLLANDLEIIEKRKELELAKIERQIAEERAATIDPEVIERIVGDFKSLLFELSCKNLIPEEEYERLISHCPWCTSCSVEMVELDDGEYGWKCRYCGREVV